MHPILFRLGEITIHSYGLCMALGILCAYAILQKLARPRGLDPDRLSTMVLILVFSGLAGARLFFVAEHFSWYANDLMGIFRIWEGGLMFYGSILVAGPVLILLCRLYRYPAFALLDLFAVVVPVGQAFGRVGCFLNGCCHGRASTSFLAVRYPAGSFPDQATGGQAVLPSQLFETAGCVVLFFLLLALYRYLYRLPAATPETEGAASADKTLIPAIGSGLVLAAYCVGYGALRILIEWTRGDERLSFGALSIGQTISLGGFLIAVLLVLTLPLRRAAPPQKQK